MRFRQTDRRTDPQNSFAGSMTPSHLHFEHEPKRGIERVGDVIVPGTDLLFSDLELDVGIRFSVAVFGLESFGVDDVHSKHARLAFGFGQRFRMEEPQRKRFFRVRRQLVDAD